MRNVRNCLFCLIIACPVTVFAADLYGKVWVSPGSKPANGAKVSVSCPGSFKTDSTVDKYGRYRLTKLPSKTDCQLWIKHGDSSSGKVNVYSGSGSKSMNLELRKSGNGWKVVIR
jgi:hypothetical protein